jgi:hypothetical protein
MSTTGKITEGHILFTKWACKYGDESVKPSIKTITSILKEMNIYGSAIEGYKIRKTPQGLWPYMEHSKVPCCPPKAVRRCIEYISRDEVPATSWDNVVHNIGRKEKA